MSVAAIVLAAGFSRRLGRPKQTLEIGGETLVERAARLAREAGMQPVLVVVNAAANFGEDLRSGGSVVVLNQEADEGLASSIRAGVAAAAAVSPGGVVLMTCDQPGVRANHLRALCADPERITGSAYAGHVGVPAYFPASAFEALLRLRGHTGARELLHGAASIAGEDLELDVDTEADVLRARALYEDHADGTA